MCVVDTGYCPAWGHACRQHEDKGVIRSNQWLVTTCFASRTTKTDKRPQRGETGRDQGEKNGGHSISTRGEEGVARTGRARIRTAYPVYFAVCR